jgi:ABC-type multidrug transport system fused ATPase/permease subunit
MINVLEVERHVDDPANSAPEPPAGVAITDPRSGLVVHHGELLALASADPHETAAIADRLGRFGSEDGVLLGDVRLADLPVATVRRRIVVSEADPVLFAGTLRGELDPWERTDGDDEPILEAIGVANAEDILDALPDGLDAEVDERGRSFSGGQRQRLVLARALLSEAEALVLVEPTSAVDAHTEARIAQRLHRARHGRITVITTTSPLMLDRADRVAFVDEGRVVAEGTHRELLRSNPDYRQVVAREEEA